MTRRATSALLALAALAALAALRPAAADSTAAPATPPPPASGSAAASGSAVASGSAAAPPPPAPPPPTPMAALHVAGWPEERTEPPRPEEWAGAAEIRLTRDHAACKAARLREWIRVTCYPHPGGELFGVRVVGGSEDDVTLAEAPAHTTTGGGKETGLHVIFPVRRGDRRILTIDVVDFAWKAYSPDEDVLRVISALWLPDAPGPTIVVN